MYTEPTDMAIAPAADPAMANALQKYAEYEAARTMSVQPAFGAEVASEEAVTNVVQHDQADELTNHTLDAIEGVGSSAVNAVDNRTMDMPSFASLANLGGAVGRMGFAGIAKMTADDLDSILGPDEEIEEPVSDIDAPEIGVTAIEHDVEPENVGAGLNPMQLYAMHARTAALSGDEAFVAVAEELTMDDIEMPNVPNLNTGRGMEMRA